MTQTNINNKYIIKYIPEFIVIETRAITKNLREQKRAVNNINVTYSSTEKDMFNNLDHLSLSNELSLLLNNPEINKDPASPNSFINNDDFLYDIPFHDVDLMESNGKDDEICVNEKLPQKSKLKKEKLTDTEQTWVCDYCGKLFPCKKVLLNHKKRHEPDRWPECNICSKRLPYGMNRHIKTHSNEKPFECEMCGKHFKLLSLLKSHMEIHTNEEKYKCRYCDEKFKRRYLRRLHQRIHQGNVTVKKKIGKHVCNICGKISTTWGNNKLHLKSHSSERPYSCNLCDAKFKTKAVLMEHMRIHTGERPYVCEICNKAFTTSSAKNVHVRIHTGERNYECPQCQKRFVTNSKLVKHSRVHTGEKPHECDICLKRFAQKYNLNSHLKLHYKDNSIVKVNYEFIA